MLPSHVARGEYLTYCERVYLNRVTGTGPNWADLLPARLYHVVVEDPSPPEPPTTIPLPFDRIRLPPPAPLTTFGGDEPLRFLHIIKTGGESLEAHLAGQPAAAIRETTRSTVTRRRCSEAIV